MFRRKEESPYDAAIDATQGALPGTAPQAAPEQAAPAAPVQAAPAAPAAPSAPASIYQPQPATPLRQVGEPSRPAATASAFRPAAAPQEPARPRPAEIKPAPTAASVSSSGLIPAGVDKSGKTNRRVLTVGHDILLKGEIATCDRLVIEGKVDASLNDVHTVEIAETGSFKGVAQVEDAEVSGVFEGELVVKNRLVIYSTGRVRGKITYGEIEIERGGEMTGEIKTPASIASSPASARSRASAESREKKEDKVAA